MSFLALCLTGCCCIMKHQLCHSENLPRLPDYVKTNAPVLHAPAKELSFPLTEEDLQDIATLEAKYKAEKICAGLAAPQIGIGKAIIIFAVPDDPGMKRFRKDLVQTMPKTIWINPSYVPIDKEKRGDWEGCFSVPTEAGFIKRHTKIRYAAFDVNGKKITGVARGYLARLIQHETDHIRGKLCLEKASKKMLLDDYKTMRDKLLEQK
jgi:peptide deformylase